MIAISWPASSMRERIPNNLESGLFDFEDNAFDFVILSQTLQSNRHTESVMQRDGAVDVRACQLPQFRPLAQSLEHHAGNMQVICAAQPMVRPPKRTSVHGMIRRFCEPSRHRAGTPRDERENGKCGAAEYDSAARRCTG